MDPNTRGRQTLKTPLTGSGAHARNDTPDRSIYLERQAAATEEKRALRREIQAQTDAIAAAKEAGKAERLRTEEERALVRATVEAAKAKEAFLAEKLARLEAEEARAAHAREYRWACGVAKALNDWVPTTINYATGKIIPGHWHWEAYYRG